MMQIIEEELEAHKEDGKIAAYASATWKPLDI